jgi:hypothetical protein
MIMITLPVWGRTLSFPAFVVSFVRKMRDSQSETYVSFIASSFGFSPGFQFPCPRGLPRIFRNGPSVAELCRSANPAVFAEKLDLAQGHIPPFRHFFGLHISFHSRSPCVKSNIRDTEIIYVYTIKVNKKVSETKETEDFDRSCCRKPHARSR